MATFQQRLRFTVKSHSQFRKLVRIWGRGAMLLVFAYSVGVVPLMGGGNLLSPLKPFPVLYFGLGAALLLVWAALAPVQIAIVCTDLRLQREQVASIETQVDHLARLAGVSWNGAAHEQIDRMIEDGKMDTARKLFHQHFGGTWDEAARAVSNWPRTILLKKLELISSQGFPTADSIDHSATAVTA